MHALQPVGIRNIVHEEIPDITIFPNPGNSIFTLQGDDVLEVMVNSYSGTLMKAENSGMPVKTVDLGGYSPGIYVLHLRTAKGVVNQSVIVR